MLNSVFLVNYFVVFHSLYALQDLKVNLETVKVLEKPNKRPLSIYAINKNIGYQILACWCQPSYIKAK